VMEKLHEIQPDFQQAGVELKITGLEHHHGLSSHELSTRKSK